MKIPGLWVHVPELDGFRGVAVIVVVLYHLYLLGGVGRGGVCGSFFSIGWAGVDLFFVLSGFLITGILLDSKSGAKYFQRFYTRRILRIFPLYYAVVTGIFLLMPFFLYRLHLTGRVVSLLHPESQIYAWTYTLNFEFAFHQAHVSPLIHPLWSLSVEEQFYVIWPLAVYLLSLQTLKRLCVVLITLAPLIRIGFVLGGNELAAYVLTPCRFDSLALGALLSILFRVPGAIHPLRRWGWKVALAALTGIILLAYTRSTSFADPVVCTLGLSLIGLFSVCSLAAILCTSEKSRARRPFSSYLLRTIGKYSYAIYVFHQIVILLLVMRGISAESLSHRLNSNIGGALAFAGLAAILVVVAAAGSWWGLEKRILALKRLVTYDDLAARSQQAEPGSVCDTRNSV